MLAEDFALIWIIRENKWVYQSWAPGSKATNWRIWSTTVEHIVWGNLLDTYLSIKFCFDSVAISANTGWSRLSCFISEPKIFNSLREGAANSYSSEFSVYFSFHLLYVARLTFQRFVSLGELSPCSNASSMLRVSCMLLKDTLFQTAYDTSDVCPRYLHMCHVCRSLHA